jgi:hypothetical protein
MWRKRVDIALGILDISSSLDIDFHEPLHFCDIKEENFGINSNNQSYVNSLSPHSLFFGIKKARTEDLARGSKLCHIISTTAAININVLLRELIIIYR